MALEVTSHSIEITPPRSAKVGEWVTVRVEFAATVWNDLEGMSISVRLNGSFSDDQDVASGSSYEEKTAYNGATKLWTSAQTSARYDHPGRVTIYGHLEVYDGSRWTNILDMTGSEWFNVIE
jgi:hypothetical protein